MTFELNVFTDERSGSGRRAFLRRKECGLGLWQKGTHRFWGIKRRSLQVTGVKKARGTILLDAVRNEAKHMFGT